MFDFWSSMVLLFVTATITAITVRRKRDRFDIIFLRNMVIARSCLK